MLCVLCVACINCCFAYNVLTHALVLQWACVLVPTVTVLWANILWLAFPNYACVAFTFLLNGGLNQMMLRCLFLGVCCITRDMYSSLWLKLLCPSAF